MNETREIAAPSSAAQVEKAWSARRAVDPCQVDEAQLGRYRHPNEKRALLTLGAILLSIEAVLLLIGPGGRETIRSQLHFLPRGAVGTIMNVLQPGGVVGTVLILLIFTALFDFYNHLQQRADVVADGVEVTQTTFPALYPIVDDLRKRFDLPSTRVFFQRGASKPSTLGVLTPSFIVLPVSTLATLSPDELRFVLGHEMGHLKLGHARVSPFLGSGGNLSGQATFLSLLMQGRSLLLSSYQRAQEQSADRIGVIACRGVRPAVTTAIKLGFGSPKGGQVDLAALAPQAAEVHQGRLALVRRLRQIGKTQPQLLYRLKELVVWAGLPPEQPTAPPAAKAAPAAQPAAGEVPLAPATSSVPPIPPSGSEQSSSA